VSFALQLPKYISSGNTLIIGSGLYGITSALYLRDVVSKVAVYREDGINPKIVGVEEIRHLSQEWDNIVITTFRSWIRAFVDHISKSNTKIIMPKLMNTWPVVSSTKAIFIPPREVDGVLEFIDKKITDKLFNELVSFSNDLLTSFPSPRAGVVINTEEVFK
jgi:hypothetical protein